MHKIPAELKNYLREIYNINRERNICLIKEVKSLNKLLEKNKINHVFLKGAALVAAGFYEDIGQRMVGDIDFLFRQNDKKKLEKVLKQSSYENISDDIFFRSRHLIRMVHEKKVFAIEPHTELLKTKNKLLIAEDVIFRKSFRNGIPIPKISDLALHNIYNHEINDYGYSSLVYSYRSYIDHLSIKINPNHECFDLNKNKFSKRYFLKFNYILNSNSKSKKTVIDKIILKRFSLKNNNKYYSKIDNIILRLFRSIKFAPTKIYTILINQNYRKYVLKKFLITREESKY